MEWFANFILRLFGKDRQQTGDGWSDLVEHHLKVEQKLEQRIEQLESRQAKLETALDTEQQLRRECQNRLHASEEKIRHLEAQIQVLMAHDRARGQADGGS